MKKNIKVAIGLIAIIAIIIVALFAVGGNLFQTGSNEEGSLDIYVGAGFSKVTPELIKAFNEKYPNVKINAKYGGTGELLAMIETQKSGDVFLPADYQYMDEAMNKSYVENNTVKNITTNVPVIIVANGNPKNINSLEDLANHGVKVAIGEVNGPAIGKVISQILNKTNLTEAVKSNVVVESTTVNQLVTYITTGQADAAIVYKAVAQTSNGTVQIIDIPETQNIISTVPVGVISFSKNKKLAQEFENFVLSSEGKAIWKKFGYDV